MKYEAREEMIDNFGDELGDVATPVIRLFVEEVKKSKKIKFYKDAKTNKIVVVDSKGSSLPLKYVFKIMSETLEDFLVLKK